MVRRMFTSCSWKIDLLRTLSDLYENQAVGSQYTYVYQALHVYTLITENEILYTST